MREPFVYTDYVATDTIGNENGGFRIPVGHRVGTANNSGAGLTTAANYTSAFKTDAVLQRAVMSGPQAQTDIVLSYPNAVWNNPETAAAQGISVRASILYNGVYWPAYQGGKRIASADAGGTIRFDPIPVEIAPNTSYSIITDVSVASGGVIGLERLVLPTVGDALQVYAATPGTDPTVAAVTLTSGYGGAPSYGPCNVTARVAHSAPSVLIFGDSRACGTGEAFASLPATGECGYLERGLGHALGWANFSLPSRTLTSFSANRQFSTALWANGDARFTHVIDQLAINDINLLGVSFAALQALKLAWWSTLRDRGVRIVATTAEPYTTSATSDWSSAGVQVIPNAANEATRQAYNAWIRSNPAPLAGVLDIDAVLGNANGTWKQGAGGVSLSADGLHPNSAGHLLASAAVTPSTFFM